MARCRRAVYWVMSTVCGLLFSHLGMCALVALYAVLGALLFRAIELPNEMLRIGHVRNDTENIAVEIIANVSARKHISEREFRQLAERVLRNYEKIVAYAVNNEGYDGDDDNLKPQWTFSGALLYSVTIFTTIGYGHIAPKTTLGRMSTVVYAVVGIPLMLFCLANVAETLASTFTFIYFRVCCGYCRWRKQHSHRHRPGVYARSYEREGLRRSHSIRTPYANRGIAGTPIGHGGHNYQAHTSSSVGGHHPALAKKASVVSVAVETPGWRPSPARTTIQQSRYAPSTRRNAVIHDAGGQNRSLGQCSANPGHARVSRKISSDPRFSVARRSAISAHKELGGLLLRSSHSSGRLQSHSRSPQRHSTSPRLLLTECSGSLRLPKISQCGCCIASSSRNSRSHSLRQSHYKKSSSPGAVPGRFQNDSQQSSAHSQSTNQRTPASATASLSLAETTSLSARGDATTAFSSSSDTLSSNADVQRRRKELSVLSDSEEPLETESQVSSLKEVGRFLVKNAGSCQKLFPNNAQMCPESIKLQNQDTIRSLPIPQIVVSIGESDQESQREDGSQSCISNDDFGANCKDLMMVESNPLFFSQTVPDFTAITPHSPTLPISQQALSIPPPLIPMPPSAPLYSRRKSVMPSLSAVLSSMSDEALSLRSARRRRAVETYGMHRMPISVGVLIVVAFILGGGLVFALWEGWDLFDGAYFCFITLTTVGFGDLVPSGSVDHNAREKLIFCSVYLLVGMALIAMCFKLMQDDVVQKAIWFGQKIGLLVNEYDDFDFWPSDYDDEESSESEGGEEEIEAEN